MPVEAKKPKKSEKKSGLVGIPGPTGGTIYPGSNKGNTPGTGRPRSAVREIYRGNSELAAERIRGLLESDTTSPSDIIRAAEVSGKYGLGEAATETLADDQLVSLCLDWCHDYMQRAGMQVEPQSMAADFESYRKDRL